MIQHIKTIFAIHAIPEIFVPDNGPQFLSNPFIQFPREYGFHHQTSSPNYPQSNAEAEHCVNKAKDAYLELPSYWATLLTNGYSPAKLFMGRKFCSIEPMIQ